MRVNPVSLDCMATTILDDEWKHQRGHDCEISTIGRGAGRVGLRQQRLPGNRCIVLYFCRPASSERILSRGVRLQAKVPAIITCCKQQPCCTWESLDRLCCLLFFPLYFFLLTVTYLLRNNNFTVLIRSAVRGIQMTFSAPLNVTFAS